MVSNDLTNDFPLTPAMAGVLRGLARAARPALHTLTPRQARAAYAAGSDVLEVDKPALARVQPLALPARDGAALPATLFAPRTAARLPVLLYLHGGGFTIGSVQTHEVLCRTLAQQADCAVLALDYRLAPEHKFPTALNDAWDALQWLASHGAGLGLDTQRLAIGGDSAGGTLAAVCAVLARDAGLALALQMLIYPGTSAHQDSASQQRYAHGLVLERPAIDWFFGHYLRSPADREDWRFAPLLLPDAQGLAPAHFCLAELDPMVDEGIEYADLLRMAGVPVSLEIYKGVTHEFIKMGRTLPEARQAHADLAQALRLAFGA